MQSKPDLPYSAARFFQKAYGSVQNWSHFEHMGKGKATCINAPIDHYCHTEEQGARFKTYISRCSNWQIPRCIEFQTWCPLASCLFRSLIIVCFSYACLWVHCGASEIWTHGYHQMWCVRFHFEWTPSKQSLTKWRNGSYSRNERVFHTRYRIQPEVKSCIAHSFVVERFAFTSNFFNLTCTWSGNKWWYFTFFLGMCPWIWCHISSKLLAPNLKNCVSWRRQKPCQDTVEDKETKERCDGWREVMKAILAADPIESVTGSDVATVIEEMRNAGRRSSDDVTGEPFQQVGQRWECSQMEDELAERDATDWLMDDETLGRGLQGGREDHGEQKWGAGKTMW